LKGGKKKGRNGGKRVGKQAIEDMKEDRNFQKLN